MTERFRKYSTKFFCPECKRSADKTMQMLYLDTKQNLLTCEKHPFYKRECTCKISDMIIFDMYPETEEEAIKVIEEAPVFEEDKVIEVKEVEDLIIPKQEGRKGSGNKKMWGSKK